MNFSGEKIERRAFTIIELLVVVAIVAILFLMINPMRRTGNRPTGVMCMGNLKQIGVGLMIYATDHADQFPWQISTNSSVTKEVVESRPASEHFQVLTNYRFPPSAFICPTDKIKKAAATNFSSFNNINLSYFAALSATGGGSNVSHLILAGDRHLSVDGQPVKPGFYALNESSVPGWTEELHKIKNGPTRGCLLFVDGHAEVRKTDLPKVFKNQPVTTTRLAIP